ncbi:hypothetical protein JCM10207_002157 [Rhodosporidiobolus poonsookiae]
MSIELKDVHLHYFPICGRGEPIRLILEDAGVAYTESNDVAAFREKKMDFDEYHFNQLPRLSVNGRHLAQQGAILAFLAKATGYTGTGDIWQDELVDELQYACEDLNMGYVQRVYKPDGKELLAAYVQDNVPKAFAQFEHLFAKNAAASGYLAYDKPSYAEFHLLYLIRALLVLSPSLLSAYPTLAAWYARMLARPNLKAYWESGRMKGMLNGSENGQEKVC